MTPAMTREQMIERAAEAIQAVFAKRSGLSQSWQDVPQWSRENFYREAEAALRAAGAIDDEEEEP
jgi:hypothetical protein